MGVGGGAFFLLLTEEVSTQGDIRDKVADELLVMPALENLPNYWGRAQSLVGGVMTIMLG